MPTNLVSDYYPDPDNLDNYRVPPELNLNTRVWCKLPPDIHEYFFRKVLAGEHRAKQELTLQFYTALYNECLNRRIPADWDLDSIARVQQVMSDLNFNEQRRPHHSPAKHQAQPAGDSHDAGPADHPRAKAAVVKRRAPKAT
jgi:hypothetical protein